MKTYEERILLIDQQAASCKQHWTTSIAWLERCHYPNFHYGSCGQYSYHDYDLVGFCVVHKHIVYEGGGRRSSLDSCVAPPGSGWHYKSGNSSFLLVEVERAIVSLGIHKKERQNQEEVTMKGRVIEFHATRGFGFIETEDREKIFVHRDHIISDKPFKTLEVGQWVKFNITEEWGRQATDVVVLSDPSQ